MFKSIKDFIKRHLPSTKYGQAIIDKSDSLSGLTVKMNDDVHGLSEKSEYLFWISQRKEGELLSETKKRVFLDLPRAEGELRDIQLAERYILRKIKKICDESGVKFFLIWGTLLGAVRHEGFIPWDDDVDIGMFRSDYEKVKEAISADNELTVKRYYNTRELIKVKIKGYESIFVDIFLFEKVDIGADPEWKEKMLSYGKLYHAELKKRTLKYLSMATFDRMYPCERIDNEMAEIKKSYEEKMPFYGHGDHFCEVFERFDCTPHVFEMESNFPLEEVTFEGDKYYAFKDSDRFLKTCYGDYYSFPDKIYSHHLCEMTSDMSAELSYLKDGNKIGE